MNSPVLAKTHTVSVYSDVRIDINPIPANKPPLLTTPPLVFAGFVTRGVVARNSIDCFLFNQPDLTSIVTDRKA